MNCKKVFLKYFNSILIARNYLWQWRTERYVELNCAFSSFLILNAYNVVKVKGKAAFGAFEWEVRSVPSSLALMKDPFYQCSLFFCATTDPKNNLTLIRYLFQLICVRGRENDLFNISILNLTTEYDTYRLILWMSIDSDRPDILWNRHR